MHHLIASLLQYAQAGHVRLKRQMLSSSEVVAAVEATLAPLIAECDAEITCNPCPMVWADAVQFQQLFQNLLTNAIKYSQPEQPPRIAISGETTEEGWHFVVTDNGSGIPADKYESVFEPLTRLHGSEIPGTGMGLALCRTIVERHGGRIWVATPVMGEGISFHFVLRSPENAQIEDSGRGGAAYVRG